MLGGFLGGLSNLGQIYGGYRQQQDLDTQNQLRQLYLQQALQGPQLNKILGGLIGKGVLDPQQQAPAPIPQPAAPTTPPSQALPAPIPQPGGAFGAGGIPPLAAVPNLAGTFDPATPQLAGLGTQQFGGLGSAFAAPSGQPSAISPLAAPGGFGTGLMPPQGQLPGDPFASRGLGDLLPLPDIGGGLGPGPQYAAARDTAAPMATDAGGPARRPDLAGRTNLLPQYDALGATRPLGPGEYVMNSDGSWSSEYSVTTQDPNNPGQYMVVPSLWLDNGKPTILSEDQAAQYAVNSGLNFPRFGSLSAAEAASQRREAIWQKTPVGRSDLQPALWSRTAGAPQAPTGGTVRVPGTADLSQPASPAESQALAQFRQRESAGRYDIGGPVARGEEHTGGYQFADSTWAETTRATGIGAEYAQARDAPPAVQDANALYLYRTRGAQPWAASAGRGGFAAAHADMGSNLAPELHGIGTRGAGMLARMPQIPQAVQMMKPSQIASLIDQNFPGTSDEVKGAVFLKLMPLMNEQAKEATANAWDVWKAQTRQWEDIEGAREADVKAGQERGANWETVESDQGLVRVNKVTGQVVPVSGLTGARKLGTPRQAGYSQPFQQGGKTFRINPQGQAEEIQLPSTGPVTRLGAPDTAGKAPEMDPQKDTLAKGIAEYRIAPLSGWALRTPWGKQTMENVLTLNPDYEGTEYGARQSAARGFAAGRQGDAVRFINTAYDHLAVADDLTTGLAQNDVRLINKWKNVIKTEFGYEGPLDFEAAKVIVGDEVTKAVVGGVGSLADRQAVQTQLNAANSPEQLKGVMTTLKRLMMGQLSGLRRQYESTTGKTDFGQKLSPAAKDDLARFSGAATADTGGAPEVTEQEYDKLPSGAPYRVPGDPQTHYKP